MATSPAGVLDQPPDVQHDHRGLLTVLALLVAAALTAAAMAALFRWVDDGSPNRATPVSGSSPPTYRPAPPIHRVGPAQPQY